VASRTRWAAGSAVGESYFRVFLFFFSMVISGGIYHNIAAGTHSRKFLHSVSTGSFLDTILFRP
jgi:hypothetical protein